MNGSANKMKNSLSHSDTVLAVCCAVGRISVNGATVQDLLEAADMLQLQHVVDACCSFLLQQLHECNCIGLCIFNL